MTTGINDLMIKSGLYCPTPAIPMPDFAVPYAAPIDPKIIAAATPAKEKNGANLGEYSLSVILAGLSTLASEMDRWLRWVEVEYFVSVLPCNAAPRKPTDRRLLQEVAAEEQEDKQLLAVEQLSMTITGHASMCVP